MRKIVFIPQTYPLSSYDYEDKNALEFLDNKPEEKMYSDLNTEMHILNLLLKLEDRHKIVLMYLLLREAGYNLTHEECAKTMSISRQAYMGMVKVVRKKSKKLYRGINKKK